MAKLDRLRKEAQELVLEVLHPAGGRYEVYRELRQRKQASSRGFRNHSSSPGHSQLFNVAREKRETRAERHERVINDERGRWNVGND